MSGGAFPKYPIVSQQILNASDDETLGPWVDVRGCTNVTFYCLGTGTTSSGVISFEEAAPADLTATTVDPPVYGAATGNYSVMTTQNASTLSGGAQVAVHISSAAYYFVRARISTAIGGGGTVSVGLVAY